MQDDLYLYNVKLEMFQNILERYRDENERLSEQWRSIENKAQGTINISGVLITLSGLFIRQINSDFPPDMRLALAVAVICLFITLCIAITVLLVQKKFLMPTVYDLKRMTEEIFVLPDKELPLRRLNLIQDRCKTWEMVESANIKAYERKADRLFAAQCLLIISLFLVTMIVVRSTFWDGLN